MGPALTRSRPGWWKNAEFAFTFDAVRFEVGAINSEDCGESFASRQVDERRVSEVHRSVTVAQHQGFDVGKFSNRERPKLNDSGSQEAPSGFQFHSTGLHQMKQFRQNSAGG